MRGGHDDLAGSRTGQRLAALVDRAGGIDHVVDDDAAASLDVTHDPVRDDFVRTQRVAGLVDERQRASTQPIRPSLRHADTSRVGGDDGEVTTGVPGSHVLESSGIAKR